MITAVNIEKSITERFKKSIVRHRRSSSCRTHRLFWRLDDDEARLLESEVEPWELVDASFADTLLMGKLIDLTF